MNRSNNGLALIIGGSSGIGLATATLLAQRNIPTLIVGSDREKLSQAGDALSQFGNVETLQGRFKQRRRHSKNCAFCRRHQSAHWLSGQRGGQIQPNPFH